MDAPWVAPAIARSASGVRSSIASVSVETCQSAPSGHTDSTSTPSAFPVGRDRAQERLQGRPVVKGALAAGL